MSALMTHKRVAVRSGHKVGKSTLCCSLALWWWKTKPAGRVVMTSSSDRQVKRILWRELKRLHRGAKVSLGGEMFDAPDSGLQATDGREIIGFATKKPENMAGISGSELLCIADEASGIPEEIFEAIEGNLAGGATIILLGNPTQQSGTFFEAFHSKRELWTRFHVSSEETPNAVTGKPIVPGLATKEWVEEKRKQWGVDSPLYAVRVRGDFPAQADNAIIGLKLIDDACEGWREPELNDGKLDIGLDVARYGDDETVIQGRRGNYLFPAVTLRSLDAFEVGDALIQWVRTYRGHGGEIPEVKIDVIGVGAGVYDVLTRQAEVNAIAVNVAEKPTADADEDTKFERLRDQLWFGVRDWLKAGGKMPDDDERDAELVAPIYGMTAAGNIKVESKEETKKRLKRSPDRADAICLACYTGGEVAAPMIYSDGERRTSRGRDLL